MPHYSYDDIIEVRNLGARRANILLANGWVLLDWEAEQRIDRRDVPDGPPGTPGQVMFFKVSTINYIVGRPSAVAFNSDTHLRDEEHRQNDVRRKAREARQAEEKRTEAPTPTDPDVVIEIGRPPDYAAAPLFAYVNGVARETNLSPHQWVFSVAQDVWIELTDAWPLAYLLGGTTQGEVPEPDPAALVALRDDMRARSFLIVEATPCRVLVGGDAEQQGPEVPPDDDAAHAAQATGDPIPDGPERPLSGNTTRRLTESDVATLRDR